MDFDDEDLDDYDDDKDEDYIPETDSEKECSEEECSSPIFTFQSADMLDTNYLVEECRENDIQKDQVTN